MSTRLDLWSDAPGDQRPHVVVIGAGFGGLAAVQALSEADVRVTVIDRFGHHTFQPLLYQVATGGLHESDIARPTREILEGQTNARTALATVLDISPSDRVVTTDRGEVGYDYLVVAAGATSSFFGHDEWAENTVGLKTVDDALEIRRRILTAFERAETATSDADRDRHMTFVVVGAGPTGVELAGAIRDIAVHSFGSAYARIDTRESRVLLVEGADRVLGTFTPKLSASALDSLERLGVDVRLGTQVTDIDEDGVVADGERIPSATVLWAAGVAGSPLGAMLTDGLDRAGRVRVEPDLSLPGHPEVFVIGDLAAITDEQGGSVPGVAPAAQQEGAHVADMIERRESSRPTTPFRYRDRGSLATIGRRRAVADLGHGIRLTGTPAWLVWGGVHVATLIGFRSRIAVLSTWMWEYVTRTRSAPIITAEPVVTPDARG